MASTLGRRDFLKRSAAVGATSAFTVAGPLTAFAQKAHANGKPVGEGYGPLVDQGELALPKGFRYQVISREGQPMTDGNPTPGVFDAMAAYRGPKNSTILIRNHENRARGGEIPVVVPDSLKYDTDPRANAGNTKLVVGPDRRVIESYAILGGTATNCAGGVTPWGSWIASEEIHSDYGKPHGYNFEIDAYATGPVKAEPIKGAGRFVHEAVVWFDGALYQTEDRSNNSCLYRYRPSTMPSKAGDLAASTGVLEALRLRDFPGGVSTDTGWTVGQPYAVEWVALDDPEPSTDSLRFEAASKGAALFDRQEGMWVGAGKVYFDCTSGGNAGEGQIWELDPTAQTLTLIYESPSADVLKQPDNLVFAPNGHLLLCEDSEYPQFIRGLTQEGEIYDFARAITYDTEFAGACFDPDGKTLYVNQQGSRDGVNLGTTYAIWGPWKSNKGH